MIYNLSLLLMIILNKSTILVPENEKTKYKYVPNDV